MPDRSLAFDLLWRDRQFNRGVDQSGRKLRNFERDADRAGDGVTRSFKRAEKGGEQFRRRISGIGAVAGGAALAGLGILGAGALKLAGEFDDAYDTIRVGTGKTGKSLAGLKKDFRGVVKDIPADFKDASVAVAELNRRTGQTGKPLQALAKRMLELTRLTGGDLSTNIQVTTRLFGDWGIKTADQSKTLDKLFRASQATGVGIDQLATSVVKFGAPLRQLGFSFDQSISLLAKFEKEGVNSSLVMSGMKIALGKLAKAGKDPQKGFLDLTQRIKDAGSSAAANKIAIEAFGQRAGPDMAAAIREGRLSIKDLQKQISDGKDTILGAAKDAEDFGEKWKRTTNKIKLLAEPVVTKGLDILGTKIGDLEKFLTKNLIPKLGGLKDAWNANRDAILELLTPFDDVNDKSKTADQRAQQLADSLTAATEGIGKASRLLKGLGDSLNAVSRFFSVAGEAIHVNFVRPMTQSILGLTRFALGQWRALMGGAATLVAALPGGRNSGLGKALRNAERQIGVLEAGAQREFNDISRLSAGVTAKAPGGSQSGFGRSLGKAGKQTAEFRQAHNREMARLLGKVITVTGRAKIDWSSFNESEKKHRAQYPFQAGGVVPGAGTGDKVPAALEPGEVVWPNREPDRRRLLKDPKVRARLGFQRGGVVVGTRGLDATNDKLQEFARQVAPRLGSSVGGSLGGNLRRVLAGYGDRFAKAALKKFQAATAFTGGSGAGFGSGSWSRAINELRRERVPYNIISTFRPGARTAASGSVSFHALNRAVDLTGPNMLRIWQALTDTSPTELIYSRAPMYKSRRGWRPIGQLDSITRANHYSHVHAAYDKGGYLMPGTTVATNRTGQPERVVGPAEVMVVTLSRESVRALAAELRSNPPVVSVQDIRTGINRQAGRVGQPPVFR
jgi:hypothetical protein